MTDFERHPATGQLMPREWISDHEQRNYGPFVCDCGSKMWLPGDHECPWTQTDPDQASCGVCGAYECQCCETCGGDGLVVEDQLGPGGVHADSGPKVCPTCKGSCRK